MQCTIVPAQASQHCHGHSPVMSMYVLSQRTCSALLQGGAPIPTLFGIRSRQLRTSRSGAKVTSDLAEKAKAYRKANTSSRQSLDVLLFHMSPQGVVSCISKESMLRLGTGRDRAVKSRAWFARMVAMPMSFEISTTLETSPETLGTCAQPWSLVYWSMLPVLVSL